jgi:hypothetical protein
MATTRRRSGWLAAATIVGSLACGTRDLSDRDLVEYMKTTYDAAAMQNRRVRLGMHNGRAVLVDFLCVGVCPDYTRRVIHYDLSAGPECTAAGGVVDPVFVRVGTGSVGRPFCVPKVLEGKGDSYK